MDTVFPEPNFVVKPGAPEGEGYLLVILNSGSGRYVA